MLLDQLDARVKRSIAAELRIDFKLVGLTLSTPSADRSLLQRSRIAKLMIAEDRIRRHDHVGGLEASGGWITADLDMDWKPLDDNETVLFCGYAPDLLVTLAGSTSNLIGRVPSAVQIGSHPPTILAAIHGDQHGPDDLGRDLQAAASAVCSALQPMRFLARIIKRGPLPGSSAQAEYLLATPLYVEAIDTAGD